MERDLSSKIVDITSERNQMTIDPNKRSLVLLENEETPLAILDVLPSSDVAQVWFSFDASQPEQIDEQRLVERDEEGNVGFVEFKKISEGINLDGLPLSPDKMEQVATLFEQYRTDAMGKIPQITYNPTRE